MTRSRSDIRAGLRAGFAQRGHGTWRDVLPMTGVDPRAPGEVLLVRRTVENMVRVGELVKVGIVKEAGSRIHRAIYELNDAREQVPEEQDDPTTRMADAMRGFMLLTLRDPMKPKPDGER